MARGRMINRSAGESRKVEALYDRFGPNATTFFFLLIAWVDVNGNVRADPWWLKGNVCPRLAGINPDACRQYAGALVEVGLAEVYEVEGKPYLHLPGFRDEQVGLRVNRETPEVPVPEGFDEAAGNLPANFRRPAGYLPDTCRPEVEVEVEVEVEGEYPPAADAAVPPSTANGGGVTPMEPEPTEPPGEPPAEAVALFPDHPPAAKALASLTHGRLTGPLALLETSFLYADEAQAMPDRSVKGKPPGERRELVARALVEMHGSGTSRFSAAALAGFIRQLTRRRNGASSDEWWDDLDD